MFCRVRKAIQIWQIKTISIHRSQNVFYLETEIKESLS